MVNVANLVMQAGDNSNRSIKVCPKKVVYKNNLKGEN